MQLEQQEMRHVGQCMKVQTCESFPGFEFLPLVSHVHHTDDFTASEAKAAKL